MRIKYYLVFCCLVAVSYASAPTNRSKYTWPFASWSIWNLPIGADAVYVPAKLGVAQQQGLAVDPDVILMNPTSPEQPIYYSSAAWTGASRCTPDSGNQVLYTVPMPSNFLVPSDGNNYATAVLLPDNNTFFQTQPLCKCTSSSVWTSYDSCGLNTLDQDGIYGAHGGSGLSAIGGTIRLGELLPGAVIRHALKVNLDANLHYYPNPCYRWPASNCDGYYKTVYGGTVPQLKPGSLLAIPANVNISDMGFQTKAGASLAWTFQNYGGYIADDTWYWDKFTVETELSPDGDVRKEFQSVYGYAIDAAGTAFASDVAKIYLQLAVVDSWDFPTYSRVKSSNGGEGAGGGAPRQPWAPPLPNVGPTPGPVTAYTIFEDSVTSGWTLSSGGTLSTVTNIKYAGTLSEKLVVTSAWDNYNFNHVGFSTQGYTYLHVAVFSGQANLVCFNVQAFHGAWSSSVPQANLQNYGGLPNSYFWSVYNIPLSYLNPSGATIQTILLQDCSGTTGNIFYIDQLQFTSGPYSTTVQSTSTTGQPTTGTSTTSHSTTGPSTSSTGSTTGPTPYSIFDGSIASGWGLYSGGNVTTDSSQKYAGLVSERLTTNAPWQNYNFHHSGFSTVGYNVLHVALLAGQASDVCFEIQAFYGSWTSAVPNAYLSDYGGDPTNASWKVYNIPLSTLNPSGTSIQTILLTDCSGAGGHTFYMTQLQFLPPSSVLIS